MGMKNKWNRGLSIAVALVLLGVLVNGALANGVATRVTDINDEQVTIPDPPAFLTVFQNKLYFRNKSATGNYGEELYVYDGSNPASLALDINPGSASGGPNYLLEYNNRLFFFADAGNNLGFELYSWDGTDINGLRLEADILSGPSSSAGGGLTVYDGELYFAASSGTLAGRELYKYDGSTFSLVADINSGTASSFPQLGAVFNGKLYFSADDGTGSGRELWVYDSSLAVNPSNNPAMVADINPGTSGSNPLGFTVFSGKLYFKADGNNGAGQELWVYDGVNPPSMAVDVNPGAASCSPVSMAVFSGKLYFKCDGGDGSGIELWDWDGVNPPSLSADIAPGATSSSPGSLTVFNGKLFMSADGNDGKGPEIWEFVEDNTGPVVTASTPANGATVSAGLTSITVRYNEDMRQDGAPEAANTIANYLLVEANGDGFQTGGCDTGPDAGDTQIPILSAVYSNNNGSGPFTALLGVNPLQNGSYRLFVCGTTSVYDLARNVLNGGVDSVINFTIADSAQVDELPKTGFAPGRTTALPQQTVDKAYLQTGDVSLSIPTLDVEANIVGVPITRDGWDLNWLGNQVGWLQGTAFPSWAGNSALTAHIVDAFGQPGVFKDLGRLRYGDQVVVNVYGQEYVYEVRSVEGLVRPDDTSSIFEHEEYPWLTLVTCRGYDEETDDYRWRVVVRAVQVDVR